MDTSKTQRAYTARIVPTEKSPSDWNEVLWRTHETINTGTRVFGDWFLTCRGGLSHELGTNDDAKLLLALSWLSVEAPATAIPPQWIVPHDVDPHTKRRSNWKCVEALKEILRKRGLGEGEIEEWVKIAKPALEANIRDEAVWVNRSLAFGEKGKGISRDELWSAYLYIAYGQNVDEYLRLPVTEDVVNYQEEIPTSGGQSGRQWLSTHFGSGKKTDSNVLVRTLNSVRAAVKGIASDLSGSDLKGTLVERTGVRSFEELIRQVSPRGRRNKVASYLVDLATRKWVTQKERDKLVSEIDKVLERVSKDKPGSVAAVIRAEISDALGFEYRHRGIASEKTDKADFFSIMIDLAQRRVAGVHTWIKRAEAVRREYLERQKAAETIDQNIKKWLDDYCARRAEESGSKGGFRISRAAIKGYKEIFAKWSKSHVKTKSDRLEIVKELQQELDEEFGDARLFSELAEEKAEFVWRTDCGDSLVRYVEAQEAEDRYRRYKVPAYRHPDPLRNPVFGEFGKSKGKVVFRVHKDPNTADKFGLQLETVQQVASEKRLAVDLADFRWCSRRLYQEIVSAAPPRNGEPGLRVVSRNTRLARKAAGGPGYVVSVFSEKDWNARLQAPRRQLEALARRIERNGWDEKARKLRSNLHWFVTFSPKLDCIGPWEEFAKEGGYNKRGAAKYGPHDDKNRSRKLLWARVPGLRVLGVDLGVRFGAACAIWETCSSEHVAEVCRRAGVSDPDETKVWLEIPRPGTKSRVIFRRIASDTLENGDKHPAPWAKLETQFLIKLQGEEESRKASPEELQQVKEWLTILGLVTEGDLSRDRLLLAKFAVALVRRGIRKHAEIARIAHAWIAKEAIKPGGVPIPITPEERPGYLARAIRSWAKLVPEDDELRERWNKWIKPFFSEVEPENLNDEQALRIGQELAKRDLMPLFYEWERVWRARDEKIQRQVIRPLRNWVFPRGAGKRVASIFSVGGLSVDRIQTMIDCRRVIMAYSARPRPEKLSANSLGPKFGQRMLDDIEQLRENRAKQLASRIIEAALGGSDGSRPTCHLVAIEWLDRYKPDETRARRENRILMQWAARRIQKLITEGAQLHGLALVEVQPANTSKFCSRTNAPGLRSTEVEVQSFFSQGSRWREKYLKVSEKGSERSEDRLLKDLFRKWDSGKWNLERRTVRVIQEGGELFQPVNRMGAIQADLNAAANIGLQAVLDPDWIGAWWRVKCDEKTGLPDKKQIKGCSLFDENIPLLNPNGAAQGKTRKNKKRSKDGTNVYVWRSLDGRSWVRSSEYWNKVTYGVVQQLRKVNGLDGDVPS